MSDMKSTLSSSEPVKRGERHDQPVTVKTINQAEIDKLDRPETIKGRIHQLELVRDSDLYMLESKPNKY